MPSAGVKAAQRLRGHLLQDCHGRCGWGISLEEMSGRDERPPSCANRSCFLSGDFANSPVVPDVEKHVASGLLLHTAYQTTDS
jgi:hypothetical protein